MGLPKLNTIEYFVDLPVSKIEVKYRPFTVGEQKVLLQALEDENVNADAEKQMQIFKEYTELLDSKRDQSIKESIPDLWRMLND